MVHAPTPGSRPRVATYRVQLRGSFGFGDATQIVDYLERLGISHLYCSPYLQAAAGSTHGYDVVDHGRLNAELGGGEGHARLAVRLAEAGMSQVLDIVPNHMAVGGRANAWWWDVLAHGTDSRHAGYFDIDWDPPQPELAGIVLVPVLGDQYGRVLEAGELAVAERDGELVVRYFEHEVPLAARTLEGLERDEHGEVTAAAIEALNRDPDALDALLRRQNFRLAHWRTAPAQINYRRFFDINGLAGIRVEDPQVFADAHRLIVGLVRAGTVTGLRIDHVDGLADPEGYLERLRDVTGGAYVVVEKILERGEELPASWPAAGTSGYDFLTAVGQLFVDPDGAAGLLGSWERFTGQAQPWPDLAHEAKLQVMRENLAAEVDRLTGRLAQVCEGRRRVRDFSRDQLRDLLRELLASFGVYRVYPRRGRPASEADQEHVAAAVAAAAKRRPDLDAELLEFTGRLLTGELPGGPEADFAVHFAQVSAPVMAKGVEDTAFYRYHPLIALCEVGGDPGTFGRPPEDFHRAMVAAADRWPEAMLTLSTHDTKRSADVRARISLLAELPQAWEQTVTRWAAHNQRHKRDGWPDPATEYLLYQTLVGAWPVEPERVRDFLAKAVREAKVHTSWANPDDAYDEAVDAFAAAILADGEFTAMLERFLTGTALVRLGRITSLAQTTLLLTCPGVPDIYQGTELWDLSLVDPDNRRPVDYGTRRRLLADLAGASPEAALDRLDEGGPKLWLIHRLLAHRRAHPGAYGPGAGYEPLAVTGDLARHVVAFRRGDGLAVVVPRLVARLGGGVWNEVRAWGGTEVTLPGGDWADVLTGERADGGPARVGELLRRFPVAVLGREG